MNAVLENIKTRRSVRRYRSEQISDCELESIIEAGRYAPSGGNAQTCHFLVIQRPDVLQRLCEVVRDAFSQMEINEDLYPSIQNSIAISKRGEYAFFFHAPTLVVVANQIGYPNAMADSACALENMMLCAASLHVSSCWINQLRWLDNHPEIRKYMLSLGLNESETICGAVALGYAVAPAALPVLRKGNPVTYIRA